MFRDYYVSPGWWMSAMLVLAKAKCNSAPKEYEEFCIAFIDFLVEPFYTIRPSKGKGTIKNDKND